MASNEPCSVLREISKAEEAIKACYERVNVLQEKLDSRDLPNEKRRDISTELTEMQKLLKTHEDQLGTLHKHNRKTVAVVAALCFICFTVYMIYILVFGADY